ncbi:serine/threonine-protein kinase [Streptomyces sp. Z26]|uniref:serine/threonine-protein kinase n=1 Tax=Streptomyces sp. Z26 TaxID=2500177 RepID=UPI000EF14E0B|nr:serine/threonine-protein kinase [Streptomyces sp. Z26]RLL67665.1 serine/threonine protein kinase [Streptomyces sp. Z26]
MEKLEAKDPRRIGGYRLIGRLGAGGMGQVYLARSDRGRTVAVKLVRDELTQQEEFRARFRQEVRAARQVGGAWTAPVLDADTEAETPWVATGYIAGPSLQRVVGDSKRPLPERSVRLLATGLIRALQAVHAAGIVHRDLKPSNVLITIDGPRVIDFGIARALEATAADGGLTQTGSIVGTPGFLSPEQVRGERITPASDIFSLGSVLAYAATAHLPFGGANSGVHAILYRVAQEEADLEGLPDGLRELVTGCLAKDPAERPTLEQLLERMEDPEVAPDALDGPDEPWLPGWLIAQLGRHATELLEAESPSGDTDGRGAQLALPPAPAGAGTGAGASAPPGGASAGADGAGAPSGERPAAGAVAGAAGASGGAGAAGSAPDAAPPPAGAPAGGTPAGSAAVPAGVQDPNDPPTLHGMPTTVSGRSPVPPPPPVQTPRPGHSSPSAHPSHSAQPSGSGHPSSSPHLSSHQSHPSHSHPSHLAVTPPPGAYPSAGYGAYQPPYGSPQGSARGRSGTSVAIGVLVALLLVVSGVAAYSMFGGSDDKNDSAQNGSGRRGDDNSSKADTDVDDSSDPADSQTGDRIPSEMVGMWRRSFGTGEANVFRLRLQQGKPGETVVTITGDGPTYSCEFQADLTSYGPPVRLGPSRVTHKSAEEDCAEGPSTELELTEDGMLRRTFADGREPQIFAPAG